LKRFEPTQIARNTHWRNPTDAANTRDAETRPDL
jgi:hypothetical protein